MTAMGDGAFMGGSVAMQRLDIDDAEVPAKLGVVAHRRVCIQRQVVGDEGELVAEQGRQAAAFHTDHPRVLPAPEVAVVHQQRIRAPGHRRIENGLVGGHGTGERRAGAQRA